MDKATFEIGREPPKDDGLRQIEPGACASVSRAEYIRARTAVHALRLSPELARAMAECDADDRDLAISGRHWLDRHPEEAPS